MFSKDNIMLNKCNQKGKEKSNHSYKEKSKEKNKQKSKLIKTYLILIWLSGASLFCFQLISRYRTYHAAEQEYKDLNRNIWNNQFKSNLATPGEPTSDIPTIPPFSPNLSSSRSHLPPHLQLKKINPDYLFWLTIPGTAINYPVVRSPRPGYYLNHTFQKTENPSGSLFIQEDTPAPGNGNTVVFGHNMKDGTMFSDLKKYKDENYYNDHAMIYLYYNERWYKARIFSIQIRHESKFDCYETEFHDQTQKQEFITHMKKTSLYPTMFTPSDSDPIISLSTCYGRTERMIVQASILCYTDN